MMNDSISISVAKVASLSGDAQVRHADGSFASLQEGDALAIGDVVITSANASLQISLAEAGMLAIGKEVPDVIAIDQSVFDTLSDFQNVSASPDSLSLLLSSYAEGMNSLAQHDSDHALNIADILTDSTTESLSTSPSVHKDDTSKLSAIDAASVDPALIVNHWNHIDT